MANVVRIHEYGGPEVLQVHEAAVGRPGPNEVRLRQTVIGLNFVEVYFRRGTFEVPRLPQVLGNEAAGVVTEVGEGVTDVRIGDRVVYADGPLGAYATERLYPADRVVPIPDAISDEQAATVFLKGLTARYLLKDIVRFSPGDTVLFQAAAGGVGTIFARWAKALGVRVIGTVSREAKVTFAREAGCDAVIDRSREDIGERVAALTDGRGVKAAFDAVGKDTFRASLAALAPRGTLVTFGKASGDPEPIAPFELAARSLALTWPILPVYTATRDELLAAARDLFDAVARGQVPARPSRSYAFDEIVEAHRDLESGRTVGAAVLRV
ncbi:quinone oxidoreductase family protein [Pendulispora albinea]|uniref:Quinone oxidoreductase n=1 Tax=Pendulispora albinea TaxID=2741071 RepID=A0ABZ2M4H0_9BACT